MYLHSVLQGTAELWCSLICVFRFLSIETTSRDSYLSPLGLMPWQIFVQKEAEASWPCVCHIHQEWSMWFCVWDSFVGHSLEELSRVPGKHTRLELQESICLKLLRHPVPFTWSIWLLCPSVWLWSFHSVDNKTETQLKSGWRQVACNYLKTINSTSWLTFMTSGRNLVTLLCLLCLNMCGRKE